MNREWKLCGLPGPGDRFQKSRSRGGATALGDENVSRFHILTTKLTKGTDFPAAQRMDVIDPALGSSDMQAATVEINLVPPQPSDREVLAGLVERVTYQGR
jgi:hypothetical protein